MTSTPATSRYVRNRRARLLRLLVMLRSVPVPPPPSRESLIRAGFWHGEPK